ncbi:MAG: sigma-70 family RNA polymerase sigma factor [Ruminococcus sp.]|nr:sigma-70 family RNA polymerase sigma factor [Candidatus Apopatosoma intestinale]
MDNNMEELLHGTKDGKMLSFDAVWESYQPLLHHVVFDVKQKFSLPDSDRDDLMQEAAIALYNSACSFDDSKGVSFGLYAKICIKNRLISFIRREYNGNLRTDSLDQVDSVSPVSSDFSPEELVINKEALSEWNEKINASLTDFERSVFWLYLGGMSYTDIAEALHKQKKSVDNAIVRMKTKLRKVLKT